MYEIVMIISAATFSFTEIAPERYNTRDECLQTLHESVANSKEAFGDEIIVDIHSDGVVYAAYKNSTIVGSCNKL